MILNELRADVDSLRRKVAFHADVRDVDERIQALDNKIDYIAQTLHAIHCTVDGLAQAMTSAAAASTYNGGY